MGKKDETPEERAARKEKEKKGKCPPCGSRAPRRRPQSATPSNAIAASRPRPSARSSDASGSLPSSSHRLDHAPPAEKKGDKKEKDKKKDKPEETAEERAARKAKKEAKKAAEDAKSARPAPRGPPAGRAPPVLKNAKKGGGGYMDDMDLPSSASEDEMETVEREEKTIVLGGKTEKEDRKARQKELEAARKEALAKEQAMQEDDDAFNVRCANLTDEAREQMANSKDIKIDGFSVSARGKELLTNTDLTIVHGRRYGLVGPNGMGKTTIMKLLARRKLPVPDFIDILLVEQEVVGDDRSALESVVAADVELQQLRKRKMELEAAMERVAAAEEKGGEEGSAERDAALAEALKACQISEEDDSGMQGKLAMEQKRKEAGEITEETFDLSSELNKTYDRLEEKNDATAEARAAKILHGLGFTVPESKTNVGPERFSMHNTTKSFSGGWRMRISLARALFIEPTCLLLDEPTNHLDLRAVIWLEEYLMRWKKTLLVVSHDRDFLSSVTTDIIHLHDHKLSQYRGSFENFEEMYEQRRREANKAYEKYEKQMKAAKAAKKGQAKNAQAAVKDAAAKKAEQKRAGKNKGMMQDDDDDNRGGDAAPTRWSDYSVEFHFPTPSELPPPLISLTDCHFKYPNLEGFGLDNLNLGIDMGTRVGIIGPNGAGKSTLMNLLAGDLTPTQGDSRRSHKLRIGRYSQHFVDVLSMDENPVQYLLRQYLKPEGGSYKPEEIRAKLGKFGLPGHNHLTPIVKLSGGQKARVVFTSIQLSNPHILLMDEPTNHLDMESIDALGTALDEFEGGVVLITHDAHICGKVLDAETSEIWVVDEGAVTKFDGDFDEYRKQLVAEINAELDDE
jgi:ATP-binding cassette, subfamily F, member 1